jgi:YggT family protein
MPYLLNATDFLLQSIIGFALYLSLLRFWMQWVRADFRNQFGQFVISLTNPFIIPLRKALPSVGNVDTATVALALILAAIKIFAFVSLRGLEPSVFGYVLMSIGVVIKASVYLFLLAIFIQIIASWVNPHSHHPILSVARSISNPIMAPARRIIPPIGGLDLSPIVVILFLQLSLRLLVAPILPWPI